MVESWNIGMGAHDTYAKGVEGLREFSESLKLTPSETGAIVHHTTILKLKPDIPQLAVLMRLNRRKTWADFSFPEAYFLWRRRRSYFLDLNEKIYADKERLAAYVDQHRGFQQDEEEESDSQTLMQFLEEVADYNNLVAEVEARTRQFLQG